MFTTRFARPLLQVSLTLSLIASVTMSALPLTAVSASGRQPANGRDSQLTEAAKRGIGASNITASNVKGQPTSPTTVQSSTGRLLLTSFATLSVYAVNADPTDGPSSFDVVSQFGFPSSHADFPSVAQNGTIAFLATFQNSSAIWAMNADGTNKRQVTFPNSAFAGNDNAPVISPDGTQIAFLARRFASPLFSDGAPRSAEVFVVNIDGTNMRQITASEQLTGGGVGTSADAVDWDGNSSLIVAGLRTVPPVPPDTQVRMKQGLYRFSLAGGGQTTIRDGLSGAPVIDVSPDGTKIAIVDGVSSAISIIRADDGTTQHALSGSALGTGSGHSPGGIRFSPDSTKIVYGSDAENGCVRTIGVNGTNRTTVRANTGNVGNGKWWMPGPPIPVPARLVMDPATMVLPADGVTTKIVTPTLLDANDNPIFHSAELGFICDSNHPCSLNPNNFEFFQDGRVKVLTGINPTGYASFCGTSGGLTGCAIIAVGQNVNFAEIRASKPSTNTNGAGGPGILTVRRETTQPGTPFSVDFTTSGSAVRDLDYSLNVVGNSLVIPAGQSTFDLRVTPLRAAGNKTVTVSIRAQPGAIYLTEPGRDSANVNIVDNGVPSLAPSLSSVTPDKGGDQGSVLATVRGLNIRSGATVKLTRTGQPDITDQTPSVAPNGASITAHFNLIGKAQGAWNVVVTNTDSSTAQLPGGFLIEPNREANIWVDILGNENIRASHIATSYTVFFGNSGNVDAIGVPLFISGIPLDAEVELFFDIAPITDMPALHPEPFVSQIPNVVRTTTAGQAIPLFIPIVRAGQVGALRFSIRFSSVDQNDQFEIAAVSLPPLFKVVSQSALGPLAPNQGGPDDIVIVGDPSADCATAIIFGTANCAIGFVPGAGCAGAITSGILQGVQTLLGGFGERQITRVFNYGQIAVSVVSFLECASRDLVPGISQALDIVDCLAGAASIADACFKVGKRKLIKRVQSADPNDKSGAIGSGSPRFVSGDEPLRYLIRFENLPTASAPAQTVVVTDQLDTTTLDLTTFALTQITFGDTVIDVPAGTKNYTTDVDLRPTNNLIVRVSSQLNTNTGLMTWQFDSLDPFTRQPTTEPLAGFLPPNVIGTEGSGSVSFTISPKNSLAAGTEIRNRARIVFDLNPHIDTNEWLNTIDNSKPTSSVQTLNAQQPFIVFDVNWSGTDTGSGVGDYTLYVSENSGPYQVNLASTSQTSTLFVGKPNTNYSFYVIARDQTGNTENVKTSAEATTHTSAVVLNPIDDPRFFVRQHYLDFLNRSPDTSGLNFWANEISSCGGNVQCIEVKRTNVSAAFYLSIEFQQTAFLVYRLYKAAYGNVPNTPVPIRFNELLPDGQKIGKGIVVNQAGWEQALENNKQSFTTELVGRTRFTNAYPMTLTAAQFVDQLNTNAGNPLSQSERAQLISDLAGNTKTRAQVLRAVAEDSDLVNAEFNRAFVLMQYFGYLRRNPDAVPDSDFSGYNFWLNKLNQFGGNFVNAEMVKAFILSGEYRHRFGQ